MTCDSCGTASPPGARFCRGCGGPLDARGTRNAPLPGVAFAAGGRPPALVGAWSGSIAGEITGAPLTYTLTVTGDGRATLATVHQGTRVSLPGTLRADGQLEVSNDGDRLAATLRLEDAGDRTYLVGTGSAVGTLGAPRPVTLRFMRMT